jgi:hypothetical protein
MCITVSHNNTADFQWCSTLFADVSRVKFRSGAAGAGGIACCARRFAHEYLLAEKL